MKIKGLLFIVLILIQSVSSFSQVGKKIQAGIIQYIVQNVEWPEKKSQGNFTIYVVGDDPIFDHLESILEGKAHNSQTIDVKKVTKATSLSSAHIIYLGESSTSEFDNAVSNAIKENALLITSNPGLGSKGSGFNFVIKDGKQAYEINEKAIDDFGLKVSSKLRSLGIAVK